MGGLAVRTLPHNNKPFESFASPVAGKKAKMLRVGCRFVADLQAKLLMDNDVTVVTDV